jgi:triphosphatase
METEIELKFFVSPNFSSKLLHNISAMKVLKQGCRRLENVYFDTADLSFRQHDMGIRVRSFDGVNVQTLKTAGRVVAGLHQRPEYNVDILQKHPDLTLHPESAWPDGFDYQGAQSKLVALFSTNFERQQWLIALTDGSQIEVAFDQGEVRSGDRHEPICEVELELILGQPEALFTLARTLCDEGGMRLGNLSKAARGYRLAFDAPQDVVQPLAIVPMNKSMSLEQAFVATLEHSLAHWHYHEQIFMDHNDVVALSEIHQSVMALRQGLTTFGKLIPRRASSLLRQELQWLESEFVSLEPRQIYQQYSLNKGEAFKKLDNKKHIIQTLQTELQALPDIDVFHRLFCSQRYCSLLLDLSRWILNRSWVPFLDEKSSKKLQADIKPFACLALERGWLELLTSFREEKHFERSDYLDQRTKLERQLMMDGYFGALFSTEKELDFQLPWRDLLQGIEDLSTFETLRKLGDLLSEKDQTGYLEWIERREASLLHAMAQSRQACLAAALYWG